MPIPQRRTFCLRNEAELFFFFGHTMQHAGVLFPRPGMEPVPPALEAQILNHWTTREVLKKSLLNKNINQEKLLEGEALF